MARPIPWRPPAPVTMAIFPFRSYMFRLPPFSEEKGFQARSRIPAGLCFQHIEKMKKLKAIRAITGPDGRLK